LIIYSLFASVYADAPSRGGLGGGVVHKCAKIPASNS
jgi:hypothetical protein